MNREISAKQLMYSVGAFISASSLLTSNLYDFARNDSWICVITGFVVSYLIVIMYGVLTDRYPGASLIEINDAVFGKYAGKAVSFFYIFYFLSLACFNTRDLGDFVKGFVLPSTPLNFIFVIFICVCAWAVRKGPVSMTRYGMLATVIVIAAVVLNSVFLYDKTDMRNLQPVLTLPLKNYVIGTHIVTMLPFCEIISFMMFVPYLKKNAAFGSAAKRGLIIGAVGLLLVVLRDIFVLGNFTLVYSMPTFSSIRLIDIGDILTRLEIVYAVILMSLLFYKVSIVYFATVSGFSQLMHVGSYKTFIFIFGVLIVIYAPASFISAADHAKWNLTAAATYSSFFILVLPVLTLVVSTLRGSHKKNIKISSWDEV